MDEHYGRYLRPERREEGDCVHLIQHSVKVAGEISSVVPKCPPVHSPLTTGADEMNSVYGLVRARARKARAKPFDGVAA